MIWPIMQCPRVAKFDTGQSEDAHQVSVGGLQPIGGAIPKINYDSTTV